MSIREPGICPVCGQADLEYAGSFPDGDTLAYGCSCPECGYTGQEIYELTFAGHTDANDPTGAFIK